MKKVEYNPTFLITDPTGVHKDKAGFLAAPPRPSAANNLSLIDNAMYELSPEYRALERQKRRWRTAQEKLAEIERQQAELDKQKAELI